jgi:hypothetical protein
LLQKQVCGALAAELQRLCCQYHSYSQALHCLHAQMPAPLAEQQQPCRHASSLLLQQRLALHPTWPAARRMLQLLQ